MKHKINNNYILESNSESLICTGNYSEVYKCNATIKKTSKNKFNWFLNCITVNTSDDEMMNDEVIIKSITNNKPSISKLLNNEILCLLELDVEPHIIHLIHMNNLEHTALYNNKFLVMEYCKGGDLFDYYIKQRNDLFSEKEVKIIMYQIIRAVGECHKHNIIHGDIKMENIGLVYPNDIYNLRLLDFGGAIKFNKKVYTNDNNNLHNEYVDINNLQYSRHFTPPELITSNSILIPVDNLIFIDFWELGILMYLLLTKRYPYEGKTDNDIKKNIKLGRLKWPNTNNTTISTECKKFVESLLVHDPIRRCNLDFLMEHPETQTIFNDIIGEVY